MINETLSSKERVEAAINLQPVDRVPVMPMTTAFPALYHGMSYAEVGKNKERARQCSIDVFDEVGGWDGILYPGYTVRVAPRLSAILDQVPLLLQPGRELPEDSPPQSAEHRILTLEDYDLIIKLGWRDFADKHYSKIIPVPEDKLIAWAERQLKQFKKDVAAWEEKGVPCWLGGGIPTPLMLFSGLRSLIDFTLDLHRYPDKVAAVFDAVVDDFIQDAFETVNLTGLPWIMLGLERGGCTYYSLKIFERFELPYIERMVKAFTEEGLITLLHFDGDWTANLPYLKQLPKAKCICELDSTTDIFKAKEVLDGHMCIMGDVPASLSTLGTPKEMETYCAKLIDVIGKGGGFILSSGCELPADTKFDNFKAMIDTAKKRLPALDSFA
jgi:uroporphyrinogen-III decarboxylase